ncbi:MAG TPA: ABC transporter ATP-binding protein [Phototrophicaceae bacterium]|nr:ABC transporter ATP-binding protein [Phototrophicaceae bacterium]
MSIVHTEALTKVYGNTDQPIYALNAVSLEVEEGEFLAIMGPSGSGKSTLLYLLGGLDRPTSGKVWLRDADMSVLNDDALSRLRRESLGFVFQFFNLVPVLTARENVAMPLILDGVGRSEALKRADEALEKVGLSERGSHRPAELSGGQQQRAALARALIAKPAVILADEPTGNLDSRASDEVVQMLRQTVDQWKQTMILVTHDPRVAAHADRIIFLKDGKIADDNRLKGQGKPEQIREQLSKMALG